MTCLTVDHFVMHLANSFFGHFCLVLQFAQFFRVHTIYVGQWYHCLLALRFGEWVIGFKFLGLEWSIKFFHLLFLKVWFLLKLSLFLLHVDFKRCAWVEMVVWRYCFKQVCLRTSNRAKTEPIWHLDRKRSGACTCSWTWGKDLCCSFV